jgi:hypothetical protein
MLQEDMATFDFASPAELFPGKGPRNRRPVYRRFDTAGEAIRFAIEELSPANLVGAVLEVCEERYGGAKIRKLYESADYPFPRLPLPADHSGHGNA